MASIFTYIPHVVRVVDQVCAGLFGYLRDTFTHLGHRHMTLFLNIIFNDLSSWDEARNLGLVRATDVCRSVPVSPKALSVRLCTGFHRNLPVD